VGAAGGLGGFFPPLVMVIVKSLTGTYTLGFVLLALVAALCLIVLMSFDRRPKHALGAPGSKPGRPIGHL
jgi:NNP family nitrate/nitrite transporter-like MFS transporter